MSKKSVFCIPITQSCDREGLAAGMIFLLNTK